MSSKSSKGILELASFEYNISLLGCGIGPRFTEEASEIRRTDLDERGRSSATPAAAAASAALDLRASEIGK